jgi:hypothetical protein
MTETVRLTRHLLQLFQEPEWVVENGAAKAEWVENMDPQGMSHEPQNQQYKKSRKMDLLNTYPFKQSRQAKE